MIFQASIEHSPLLSGSVDMIFTDPPYLREYLHTYGWLAREAARVLKPGGFVLAMCVGVHLNDVFRLFDKVDELSYYWLYQLIMRDASSGVAWRHDGNGSANPIAARAKHIIAYSKGKAISRTATTGVLWDVGPDKRYHHWGQAVGACRYYIDCFTAPGDLVYDPFIGGGTTAVACELSGRRWIASDTDPVALETTRRRLAGEFLPRAATLFSMAELER